MSEQSDLPTKHVCNSKSIILAELIKQGPDLFSTWCLFCSLIIFISASLKLLRLLGNVKESCIDFSLNIIPSLFPPSMSSQAWEGHVVLGIVCRAQCRALSTEPRLSRPAVSSVRGFRFRTSGLYSMKISTAFPFKINFSCQKEGRTDGESL